jgi:biopolymer transport protein ExbD
MIDVMMILTIFLAVMAFLPQVRTSITAQLPESSTAENTPKSLTIELTRDGLLLEERPQSPDSLVVEVKAAVAKDPDTAFVIAADKSLPYEQVIQLLDRVRSSGAKRIGLATSKP